MMECTPERTHSARIVANRAHYSPVLITTRTLTAVRPATKRADQWL